MTDADRLREMLEEIEAAPYGDSRMSLAEDAVRLADRIGTPQLQWDARMELITTATFSGFIDKALVAFSWCASRSKANPDEFPASRGIAGLFLTGIDLLWAYKWIVQQMPAFAGIRREQIATTLDEMETQYRHHGYSLRPVYLQQARAAMELGDDERLGRAVAGFRASERDLYADCEACEAHFEIEVALHLGKLNEAMDRFDRLLAMNKSCAEVPHLTYAILSRELAQLGSPDAQRFVETGLRMCGENRDFLSQLADLIDSALLLDDHERAWSLAIRYFSWADQTRIDVRRLRFFVTTANVLRAGEVEVDELIRKSSVLDGCSTQQEVDERLNERVDQLVRRFDARNGNSSMSARVAEWTNI